MVFQRSAYRLFPDSLAQPVTEDEVTENCDGALSSNCTGSEMPELPKLMVLFSCVCDRSPGKYNGGKQAVGFMAGCTGSLHLKTFLETFQTGPASVLIT